MRSRSIVTAILLGSVLVLSACEDTLTPQLAQIVRLAELPTRLLTVQPPTNGSASPSGQVEVKDGEPLSLAATANDGYTFIYWEKVSGDGEVTFSDSNTPNSTVRLTGGNTTIRAVISNTPRTLTVGKMGEGTVTPSGIVIVGDGEARSIEAVPNTAAGYTFGGWSKTGGDGTVVFANAAAAITTVTVTGGDAQITATFLTPYTLSITAQTGGYTNPSGNRAVPRDTPVAINAYADQTYRFTGWVQTAGVGTAAFGNASSGSTTVTVTGGNATIRANFAKETVTLVERGTYQHGNFSTVPNDALDAYLYGGYLYLVGEGVTGSGVVRRWDVSSPTAPTSASGDYFYLTGIARTIGGNGTYLFIGTGSRLYRVNISNFGPSATNTSEAHSVRDLSLASSTSFYGIRSGGTITGYLSSLSSGDMITDSEGWWFEHVLAVPGGVVAVQEDNGAHRLAAYYASIGSTQGVTGPDSAVLLHNGFDMDPGWAGKPVQDVDGEYAIVPVEDENNVSRVRFYDVTALNDIQHVGSATVSRRVNRLATDTSGVNDYYVFAAAGSGDGATVYVIDMWNKSSPVVRTTLNIPGFNSAHAIVANGNYLYVVVDNAPPDTGKPTVKVFEIVKN